MEWIIVAVAIFVALLAVILSGMPVGYAMMVIGAIYLVYRFGSTGAELIAANSFTAGGNYLLLAAPLFIFMGECVASSGLGSDAFRVMDAWLGWVPGSLGVSAVATATVFGGATGFSATGIAAVGPVVLPEFKARKYSGDLGMGALGAGAALGVLIPPSVPFIVYGFLSGTSIASLFFAGVIPGLIGSVMFMGYVIVRASINPTLASRGEGVGWRERLVSTWRILPLAALIFVVLGAIWVGIATPTEAAAVGAFASILIMAGYGRLSWPVLKRISFSTLKATVMVYVIVMGASVLGQVLSASGFIDNFVELVAGLEVPTWSVVGLMMLVLAVLGMFMSNLGMLFLTLPIFIPVVDALGVNLIWFGVLTVIMTEIASLTPPVGMNLFFLKACASDDVSFMDVAVSVLPYIVLYTLLLLLIAFVPVICLWLPSLFSG